jgi:hypothetical protein
MSYILLCIDTADQVNQIKIYYQILIYISFKPVGIKAVCTTQKFYIVPTVMQNHLPPTTMNVRNLPVCIVSSCHPPALPYHVQQFLCHALAVSVYILHLNIRLDSLNLDIRWSPESQIQPSNHLEFVSLSYKLLVCAFRSPSA